VQAQNQGYADPIRSDAAWSDARGDFMDTCREVKP